MGFGVPVPPPPCPANPVDGLHAREYYNSQRCCWCGQPFPRRARFSTVEERVGCLTLFLALAVIVACLIYACCY